MRGDSFYIIVHGTVQIVKDGVPIKRYRAGDYFGEMAILLDQPRSADAVALTDVDLIAIDRNDFLTVLRGSEMLTRLERLVRVRDEGVWELLAKNSVLSALTSAQKTQLQMYLVPCMGDDSMVLWRAGDVPKGAYLVDDAIVTMRCPEGELKPFTSGAFVGEVDALRPREPRLELRAGHAIRQALRDRERRSPSILRGQPRRLPVVPRRTLHRVSRLRLRAESRRGAARSRVRCGARSP